MYLVVITTNHGNVYTAEVQALFPGSAIGKAAQALNLKADQIIKATVTAKKAVRK